MGNKAIVVLKSKRLLALSILALLVFISVYLVYVNLVPGPGSIQPEYCPKCLLPLTGELSARDVSCSLATGVCDLMIVNNSTTPLQLLDCQMSVNIGFNYTAVTYITTTSTATITLGDSINGTLGGPAVAGIPANSQIATTCALPTTELAYETSGSSVVGGFQARLVESEGPYSAGAETAFNFQGTWS
jgi:hypothetical protein